MNRGLTGGDTEMFGLLRLFENYLLYTRSPSFKSAGTPGTTSRTL
jgi:hypothetical protein